MSDTAKVILSYSGTSHGTATFMAHKGRSSMLQIEVPNSGDLTADYVRAARVFARSYKAYQGGRLRLLDTCTELRTPATDKYGCEPYGQVSAKVPYYQVVKAS